MCDSTVRSIFNENFVKKKRFVGLVNSAWDPLTETQLKLFSKKKKKKEKKKREKKETQT